MWQSWFIDSLRIQEEYSYIQLTGIIMKKIINAGLKFLFLL